MAATLTDTLLRGNDGAALEKRSVGIDLRDAAVMQCCPPSARAHGSLLQRVVRARDPASIRPRMRDGDVLA